ncbi:MAG: pilus assembly protein PilM [Gammaproteobacteria bacterium]|nr:pilus assembly protein PilM [Gammaproteobacteria bacterium]
MVIAGVLKHARPFVPAHFLGVASTGAIGIDFGTERVNLVQVARLGGECRIHAAASLPYDREREALLDAPLELKRLLRHAFAERPFRGRKVIASVPPSIVEMLVINYRCESPTDEVAAIVRATEERLGGSIAARVVDYLPIARGNDGNGRAALVAVADHDAVVGYLEALRKCSLDVVALEVGPIAIQRLIAEIDKDAASTVVAITFGTVKSFVTVLSNGQLLLDRDIDFGTRAVVSRLGDALDCTPAEALDLLQRHGLALSRSVDATHDAADPAAGIKSALSEILKPQFIALAKDVLRIRDYVAAETRGSAGKIYAFGSLARWPNADRLLSSLCGVEISSINPFYGLDVAEGATDMSDIGPISGVAVATGLALRETT